MSQTTAQKEKAVRFWSGVLKINNINIGLLDNAELNVEYNTIQIRAHNGYLPAKKKVSTVTLTADVYEIDPDNLALVDGGWTVSNVAASAVNVTGEAIAAWVVGTPILLANHNGDGTVNTSIVVDVDGSPITEDTDYTISLLNGQTYIVPMTSQSGTIDVDYTYTPAAKDVYTITDLARTLDTYPVVFENTDENGKKFSITIPKGYASGNLAINFVSDDAVDEVMTLPITITANADDSNVLVKIEDEQTV